MADQLDFSLLANITDPGLRAAAESLGRTLERRAQDVAAPKERPAPANGAAATQFPLFPEATRPVSNDMARSALFSCVQGADRLLLHSATLATLDGVIIEFSGEQFNQDDCDTLMQLVFMARHQPLGEFVMVSSYAVLQGLGRGRGKREHDQLRREIERLTKASVTLRGPTLNYTGHLIDESLQDVRTKHWMYRFNARMRELFGLDRYTLIDWERRKNLKRKDLARWLQLYLATHARPFPVSVVHLRNISGSRASALREFRRMLRTALIVLVANHDIDQWYIDVDTDLVYVDRSTSMSASQRRHMANQPLKLRGSRRKN